VASNTSDWPLPYRGNSPDNTLGSYLCDRNSASLFAAELFAGGLSPLYLSSRKSAVSWRPSWDRAYFGDYLYVFSELLRRRLLVNYI